MIDQNEFPKLDTLILTYKLTEYISDTVAQVLFECLLFAFLPDDKWFRLKSIEKNLIIQNFVFNFVEPV